MWKWQSVAETLSRSPAVVRFVLVFPDVLVKYPPGLLETQTHHHHPTPHPHFPRPTSFIMADSPPAIPTTSTYIPSEMAPNATPVSASVGEIGSSMPIVGRTRKKVRARGSRKPEPEPEIEPEPDPVTVTAKPVKRRRVATVGTRKLSKRVLGRLSIAPSLPYDVLVEIFAYLTPGDLLGLSRLDKSFRILINGARFLWRQAFANVEGPPLPEDMPLRAWAHLLYGPPECSRCGHKPCKSISYTLQKRLCKTCIRGGELYPSTCLQFLCAQKAEYLLEFLHGHVVDVNASDCGIFPHYWRDDVLKLKDAIDKLPTSESNASPDAMEVDGAGETAAPSTMTREKYLQQCREATAKRHAHARKCNLWEHELERQRIKAMKELKAARKEDVTKRLLALGHELKDITVLQHHSSEFRQSKVLTESAWERILPGLETKLEVVKASRMALEAKTRRRERDEIAWKAIAQFFRVVPPPILSPFLPTKHDLTTAFPKIAALLEPDAPADTALHAQVWALRPTFQRAVSTWMIGRKLALVDAMPVEWRSKVTAADNVHEAFNHTPRAIRAVFGTMLGTDLAASVFHCDGHQRRGHSHAEGKPKPIFSLAGHRVVLRMLELLGLEPLGTTALMMDRLRPYFVCVSCAEGPSKSRPKQWRAPRCWRSSLQHALQHHKGVDVKWGVLADDKFREYVSAISVDEKKVDGNVPRWGCNHCRDYLNFEVVETFDELWYHDALLSHCIEQHKIEQPREGNDYFCHARVRRTGHYLSMDSIESDAEETSDDDI
ncbi:hypothetical protein OF83DRAFT_1138199 [Amylostereum chailletii]|nr:hypothetical protein OF83DRAFT_1138199 [Amylostereum chailletii]